MANYVVLLRYTELGMQNIKQAPSRLDEAKRLFKSMGAELKQFFLTMGRYDAVAIVEAPDDETVAKLALTRGATGTTRSETMRAFTQDKMRKIIASLP